MIFIENAKTLKNTRGTNDKFLINFINNFGCSCRLMHSILPTISKFDEELKNETLRWYLISIASCLETFFRDITTFLLEKDEKFLTHVLSKNQQKISLVDMRRCENENLNINDIIVSNISFINLETINSLLSFFFKSKSFLEVVSEKTECAIPSKHIITKFQLDKDWKTDFESLFKERNKLVHNANSQHSINFKKMALLESLALLVAQLSTIHLLQAMNRDLALVLHINGKEMPVILLVNDLLSDDWELAENKEISLQFKNI